MTPDARWGGLSSYCQSLSETTSVVYLNGESICLCWLCRLLRAFVSEGAYGLPHLFFSLLSFLLFCNFCSHREGHRRGMSVASITKAKHQRKYLLSQALMWEYDMPSLTGVSVGPGGLCVLAEGLSQVGDWRSCTEPYVKGTSFPPVLLLCLGLSYSFFPSFSCFSPRSTRSQPLSLIHFVSFPYSLSISFLHP